MNGGSSQKIRELNDSARTSLKGCKLVYTGRVKQIDDLTEVICRVQEYSNFDETSDPFGEHDFGSFNFHGQQIFWKFDYYDLDLQMRSLDPAEPSITRRVLTIMLAEEY